MFSNRTEHLLHCNFGGSVTSNTCPVKMCPFTAELHVKTQIDDGEWHLSAMIQNEIDGMVPRANLECETVAKTVHGRVQ